MHSRSEVNNKFKTKSDLEVFKALQGNGRLSQRALAKKTGMPPTTAQGAFERLQERGFYRVQAVPDVAKFPEVAVGVLSFSELHPNRVRELERLYTGREEVRTLLTNSGDVVMILMESSRDRLAELMFEIMKVAKARPGLHILSPGISKMEVGIPAGILDEVYPELSGTKRE